MLAVPRVVRVNRRWAVKPISVSQLVQIPRDVPQGAVLTARLREALSAAIFRSLSANCTAPKRVGDQLHRTSGVSPTDVADGSLSLPISCLPASFPCCL